jgi:hypothetical protein
MTDPRQSEVVDDRSIDTIVFEALGEASMCWNPRPSDNVFDSTHARDIGERLLAEIQTRIAGDRTDELIAERDQLRTEWHEINDARRRYSIENTRLRSAAQCLVAAAKAWTAANQELTSPDVRQRAVNALAEAIDAFDPMLSETTGSLEFNRPAPEDDEATIWRAQAIVWQQRAVVFCQQLVDCRTELDRLRASVAHLEAFAESEILDRVAGQLGADLRCQLDGDNNANSSNPPNLHGENL